VLSREIEEFARALVRNVRDASIRNCDALSKGSDGSPIAKRWKDANPSLGSELPSVMIPDSIDEAVFQLLHAIDEGLLRLKYVSDSGREVDLRIEGGGELAGWYMMSGGWRAMFSNERFVDDFSDLT